MKHVSIRHRQVNEKLEKEKWNGANEKWRKNARNSSMPFEVNDVDFGTKFKVHNTMEFIDTLVGVEMYIGEFVV